MVDMAKMKEEALQRKRQHEEKELKKQLGLDKRPARRSSSASRERTRTAGRGTTRNPSAQRALAQRPQPKKRKRSVSRWVLDILLVLGALLVVLVMLSPFR
ncbi:hypothetical protein [Marinospirillum alkaliphilum]|uniref:Uncharacterized protein n=1 Tax=Marinospirillum alkaliphilum DSM 21637 TaxID=1122209 RepID=A0A1K1TCV1_9GAMM|nr:hypothetical protein [Marinospirillum alkaliphilum]SFW98471.1 hypothetical protein SAMN02745752_00074 [Marinospirillum alkaliphilum DSM 21637]